MNKRSLVVILLLISAVSFSQVVEEITIAQRIKLESEVLKEERTIFVSTPLNYATSSKSYPVLYLLDGSYTDIRYSTGLVSTLSQNALCPEMIVVAIANTDRFRDMTPNTANINYMGNKSDWGTDHGKADKFLEFIKTELFPYIEKNYRTEPYRVFAGHSNGGMCVVHAFLSHNEMFNGYIGSSPSLWWDSGLFERTAREKLSSMDLKQKSFYFSAGSKEYPGTIRDSFSFAQTLEEKSPEGFRWMFDFLEGEDHMSQKPTTLNNGLRFIFDGWGYDYSLILSEGIEYIDSFYKKQSDKYGFEIKPSELELITFGYAFIRRGQFDFAIATLKKNAAENPNSANAWDSLGDAYKAAGRIDDAIEYYTKAVALAKEANDSRLETFIKNLEEAKALKGK